VQRYVLSKVDLAGFVKKLKTRFEVFGPVAKWNGPEFMFAPIDAVEDLRLDYDTTILPPHKKYFHPTKETLFTFADSVNITGEGEKPECRQLLLGVHACDVNALLSLDRVFLDTYPDLYYKVRRENTVIVALNCTSPCKDAFCSSFNTGPGVDHGFNLVLTDIGEQFLVEVGSSQGQELALGGDLKSASDEDLMTKNRALRSAQEQIKRHIDTRDLGEFLQQNLDHPKWEVEAERCLACGSCTNVCPTCFCFYLKDSVDLNLSSGERPRVWDSCMSLQFSRVAMDHIFRPGRTARLRHCGCRAKRRNSGHHPLFRSISTAPTGSPAGFYSRYKCD
jgi:ferredoxin